MDSSIIYGMIIILRFTPTTGSFFRHALTDFPSGFSTKYDNHPMLYFDQTDVELLKSKTTSTHRFIFRELEQAVHYIRAHPTLMPPVNNQIFSSSWNEVYGNNLPPLAMYYVLSPDETLLDYIKTYMDRMAGYNRWLVADLPKDEVPLAHSLVGFATAYDMLYPYLDEDRRDIYAGKIIDVTRYMHKCSETRTWGSTYLQNHQATNVIALLIGSLVAEIHLTGIGHDDYKAWKIRAVTLFERTMQLLESIDDGSLDEGVGYVGYTVRSISQYVFLVKRHLNKDHSNHPWLRRHYEYIYHTIIPGLSRTVGIADSPQAWFYGPESQLYFLDSFVLKDGRGNWLAEMIKRRKIPIMRENRPHSQKFTTLHTELLFYDASIPQTPPKGYQKPELHYFCDWGVVTYRSGSILDKSESFLSFKSSKLHGDYVHYLANTVFEEDLRGWKSFNPGHEHPDQNSVTFWTDGQPFISDGLYGPKYPYLDNVLMFKETFSLGKNTPCTHPWVGQLGVCKKWLDWRGKEEGHSHGEILFTKEQDGIVLSIADSVGAYTKNIGLKHVYRSVVLLQKDMLLIQDYVVKTPGSRISHIASFFNNFMHNFKEISNTQSGISGLTLDCDRRYKAIWLSEHGDSPPAKISTYTYISSDKSINTSNANITFKMNGDQLLMIYLFTGPNVNIKKFRTVKSGDISMTKITTSEKDYEVSLQLRFSPTSSNPLCLVTERNSNFSTEIFASSNLNSTKICIKRPDFPATLNNPLQLNDRADENSTMACNYIIVFMVLICVLFFKGTRRRTIAKHKKSIYFVIVFSCVVMIFYCFLNY